jgi:hypothetical protein
MAEYTDREHYIPIRKNDLADLLLKDERLRLEERGPLREFFKLVSAVYHFEYYQRLEELKDAYAPFDPDSETKALRPLPPEERAGQMEDVFGKFTSLMERANFKRLTREEIQRFIEEVPTDWGLDAAVNLDAFERLEVYARGDVMGTRSRRLWWKLWRKEEIRLPVFSRLVLLLKLKKDARVDADIHTDAVFLKVFKDVPKADLDMLLPGARVRLSKLDRSMIFYPMITGIVLMLYSIVQNIRKVDTILSDLMGATGALLSWSAALALGGYGYKSYYSWQVKKQKYNFRLTRSLYYQTLDSNTGVLMRLLDEAEEQECRETFLAYYFLWKYAPPEGWTAGQLDDYVELELERKTKLKVDFEIGDALDKLERLRIVEKSEGPAAPARDFGLTEPGQAPPPPPQGPRYRAVSLERALELIDDRWDNYFKYANP